MSTLIAPVHQDPTYLRSRDAWRHLIHTLSRILPPPVQDTPEDRACRDNAAIAEVAALCPANPAEATLAAQHVAANAQAMDCLRLSHGPGMEPTLALKCSAQAASMMRQSHAALRLLLRAQAVRQKRDADTAMADAATWTEYRAGELMAEALAHCPPAPTQSHGAQSHQAQSHQAQPYPAADPPEADQDNPPRAAQEPPARQAASPAPDSAAPPPPEHPGPTTLPVPFRRPDQQAKRSPGADFMPIRPLPEGTTGTPEVHRPQADQRARLAAPGQHARA